jgi:hypothetical protein
MGDPTFSTLTASATQTIKVCAINCQGSGDAPTIDIEVYCAGDSDGTPQDSVTGLTVNTTMTELTHTFTDADVTCSGASEDIEIGVFCTGGGGGPGSRSGCGLELIEWQSDTSEATATRRIFSIQ